MNYRCIAFCLIFIVWVTASVSASGETNIYIDSLSSNGRLTWNTITSPIPDTAITYTVEHASSLLVSNGWARDWLDHEDFIFTGGEGEDYIPIFYRIKASVPESIPDTLTNGLVLHCKFNGNAYDEISGVTGTTSATLYEDRFGTPNQAYYFDGVNDYIEFPDTNTLDLQNFSISTWVQVLPPVDTNQATSTYKVLCKDAPGGYSNYTLYFRKQLDAVALYMEDGLGKAQNLRAFMEVNPNRYYHVVATFSGGWNELYVNRRLLVEAVAEIAPVTNRLPLHIGAFTNTASEIAFHGSIDSLRIYNRALTPEEVEALYFIKE